MLRAVKNSFKNYLNFKDRASRTDYWQALHFYVLLEAYTLIFFYFLSFQYGTFFTLKWGWKWVGLQEPSYLVGILDLPLYFVYWFIFQTVFLVFIPLCSLSIRRYLDLGLNKPAALVLLSFGLISCLNLYWFIIQMSMMSIIALLPSDSLYDLWILGDKGY